MRKGTRFRTRAAVAAAAAVSLVAGLLVGLQATTAQAAYPTTQSMYGHQWGTTSSTTVWAQIYCPTGKYATGGGGETDLSSWTLQKSFPVLDGTDPRGWRVQYRYTAGDPINVRYDISVYALCTT